MWELESNGKPEICMCVSSGFKMKVPCFSAHACTRIHAHKGMWDVAILRWAPTQKLSQALASLDDLEMSDKAKQKAQRLNSCRSASGILAIVDHVML